MLLILEDLGKIGCVTKDYMLSREQYYLDIIFKNYSTRTTARTLAKARVMNNCPIAATTLAFKHKPEFINSRLGYLNPRSPLLVPLQTFARTLAKARGQEGKQLSPEFLYMQTRNKTGKIKQNFGANKSTWSKDQTLCKLIKLVYVYNSEDLNYIGSFPTVACSKTFKIGKDTLSKYIKSGLPLKGKIYSRTKLYK
jgi:hypothetical protein